jgi:hypothetical protein
MESNACGRGDKDDHRTLSHRLFPDTNTMPVTQQLPLENYWKRIFRHPSHTADGQDSRNQASRNWLKLRNAALKALISKPYKAYC